MKLTKEDFIKKAKIVHTGENLDYSKVVYNGLYKKVCIIDHDINPKTGNEYGEYWQTPRNHLKGQKHPLKSGRVKISQDEFIERAKKVHKDENLDYSLVHYVNMHKKVKIIDNDINPETGKEYGIFEIEANSFLKGHTNAEKAFDKRGKKKRIGLDEFIRKSKEVHKGENLDYSKFIYKSMREKGIIIDHDINPRTGKEYGEYLCSPSNHLKGKGHPVKGLIKQGINNRISQEEFIRRSKEAHPGENLDYSKAHYITGTIPVCIIDHDINPRTGELPTP